MASSNATDEPSFLLRYEQIVHAGTHLGSIAYGIHIVVAYRFLTEIAKDKERRHWRWIPFVAVQFILGTINIASSINFNEQAWIDKRNYPGGPSAFLLEQQDLLPNVISIATSVIMLVLGDGLMVYRAHVLWKKLYITAGLGSVLAASVVISVVHFIQITRQTTVIEDPTKLSFSIPFASLVTSLNVLIALMLLSRLFDLRRRLPADLPQVTRAKYSNVEALIVESGLPLGVFSLVFIILYSMNSPGSVLIFPLLVQTLGIIPSLIASRIITGTALSPAILRPVGNTFTLRGQLGRATMPTGNELSVITMNNPSDHELDRKASFLA